MKLYIQLLLLFFFFTSIVIEAQELPPVTNYPTKIYGAENQNWSISQSDEKYIYVANNGGLLEFNGSNWNLYPSPNNTITRSVNCVKNTIYAGYYMEFGYWKKNDFGSLEYTSLSKKLKEPLIEEDFWNILSFENFILFQSLHRIYIYNTINSSFKIINSTTQLPKVFLVDDGIYFQKLEEGIFRIENGNPVLISDNPILKTKILVNIFKVGTKILYQTQQNGFYYLDEKGISKWNISTNNIISTVSVYSSLQLRDGSLILGTISNGIYHLNSKGDLLHHINQEKGLNNNTVLSMFEDKELNLWLGLDNGISVINFNSPITVYNDIHGKLGSVYTAAIFNNNLYLGTNQGLFYKKLGSSEFNFIKGTDGQVWCFKIYDNTLFCGHNKGTFIVNNNEANLITDVMGTMDIKSIKNNKDILIQGYYNGLNVIEKKNNKWQFRNKIVGFNPTSRFFEFTKNGNILVNHEYKGVFKLEINNDFTKVLNYKILESAPKSLKSAITSYRGELIYAADQGIFKYNNQNENFEMDSILTNKFLKNDGFISGKFIEDKTTKTLWGFTEKSLIYFTEAKLNNDLKTTKIFLPASLRRELVGFESMLHLNNQTYLFGSSEGYLILDLNKIKENDFEIGINSILKNTTNGNLIPVSLNKSSKFENKENNVSFKFSVPEFNKYEEVNFQYQLEGIYNKWSNWSNDSEIAFKNLPFGSYTLRIKAKIGDKISNNIATFSFKIDRPWYLSNLMIIFYVILMIISFYLVHTLYKRHYTRQKRLLLVKKQREFTFSQMESDKVIMELKNEKLQNEIESKTRELSSSTMSIIKKNELLNSIKNELTVVNDQHIIKPVLKIINKNLANTNDWELFQEAFNNADTDFLKKIKTIHKALTPNDLRLCAYLRLNLSSKEIAPLLNISARSVEIKRYRLRKKMDLSHEKSLVEYILEI
ncbi:triple tyrosine motif-containing protein [Lutibacter sp.]|uniref:helix-turn-helix and ligand-binding sensor domain-containing protein n=1 Tax=Lutibacter sp. TaxID=1925666 RepID=UPI002736F689|nr:triple tyrosine motif-containing protein [Lutibacter sp.]MDP3313572.1 triple tyrosine motif-containing protein [Lutibacter sp.]